MKNYICKGNVIEITAAAAIASGDGVAVGTMFGVATGDAAIGETCVVQLTGVVSLAKKTADTFTQGCKVYWDAANKYVTTTETGNTFAGWYFGADDDNAEVRLPL